jgi:S-adenosylmethionine hydrolase
VSPSFHGRDVFAPVAGRLARDGRHAAGMELDAGALDRPDWPDELWRVVYIDRFGNAITGLRRSAVEPDTVFRLAGHSLRPARTFSDVGEGEAFWYENANGLVEFAVNRGRADTLPGLRAGTEFSR